MVKALWAVAGLAAVSLGVALGGAIINHSDAQAQSVKVSAVVQQESNDQREIAVLRAEVRTLSATHTSTP